MGPSKESITKFLIGNRFQIAYPLIVVRTCSLNCRHFLSYLRIFASAERTSDIAFQTSIVTTMKRLTTHTSATAG